MASLFLADQGLAQPHVTGARSDDQIAAFVEPRCERAARAIREREPNLARICAGRDDEVVLDLSPGAVVHHVDTWIDRLVVHLAIRRNVDMPSARIATAEIVHLAWQL